MSVQMQRSVTAIERSDAVGFRRPAFTDDQLEKM